jgi:hypothetical protein
MKLGNKLGDTEPDNDGDGYPYIYTIQKITSPLNTIWSNGLDARGRALYCIATTHNLTITLPPITTLPTSDGGFIPFDLEAATKLIALEYDDESESVSLVIIIIQKEL